MTRSLSGPYRIDRLDPPAEFYTPSRPIVTGTGVRLLPVQHVLTVNGSIGTPDRLCVGIVSQQSPFGQGLRMGISRSALRRATRTEVLAALRRNHPKGEMFKPPCIEATFLDELLDHAQATPPDDALRAYGEQTSRDKIWADVRTVKLQYHGILHRWETITNHQALAIVAALQ